MDRGHNGEMDTLYDGSDAWMEAVESRDSRFDGVVTVGVTSTGVYCRPSCPTPVRPKRSNMRFFSTSAAAQSAGFRACKRCAPDATPGSPEWNWRDDLVARAVRAIDDGVVDRSGVDGLARSLDVSSRHLHRLVTSSLGTTPVSLARARRARAARVLIETTDLAFSDVAFAAGFESVRQFNDTVRDVFASTPTELRAKRSGRRPAGEWIEVRLPFRPPLHVGYLFAWLEMHAVAGIESVERDRDGVPTYRRSMLLPGGPAVVEVRPGDTAMLARFRLESIGDLQVAIQRIRRLLDLDSDPAVVDDALSSDRSLESLVRSRPGLRLPGEIDGCDAAIRAIVHQQVSVASARSICGRLVAEHGTVLDHPVGTITHVFPSASTWAAIDPETLGMPMSRAATVVRVAQAIVAGTVDLSPAAERGSATEQLLDVKGIGPWTAAVVTMKALGDPDVFAGGDLALRRVAGEIGLPTEAADLDQTATRWRPWRSYAMHHLWAAYLAPSVPQIDDLAAVFGPIGVPDQPPAGTKESS
jgi:AraC family transcriptional regulator of adaptative response / DNA-3-methyladenine glycosylase II